MDGRKDNKCNGQKNALKFRKDIRFEFAGVNTFRH